MKKINITELVLRDGHQCHIATRLRTEDMLPVCPILDKLNFWSIEAWGGATFDTCLRYLKEDPWERLTKLRKALPNSKIQMLLRGQNLLGYRHYSDDVVDMFVKKSVDNGVDIFRVFDALNDVRNIEVSIKAVKKYKKHAEGTISYTTSPVHNIEYFVALAKKIEELGCDSLAIKDMAGLLTPNVTKELVESLVKNISLPIHMHCHATSGLATLNLVSAVEAGATIIDTCNSSYSEGASHPTTESTIIALEGMGYKTDIDLSKMDEITDYLKENRKKYWQFESKFTGLDPKVLINQVPGGMISNLSNQLKDQGALDKMAEVLKEIPEVRKDLGYPPLVTPTSQIVGTQAALNVITGERYKTITTEVRNYFLGQYGMAPGKLNIDIKKKAIGDQKEITSRPADVLKPEVANLKAKSESFAKTDEDILTYAMFPDVGTTFLQERNAGALEPEVLLNEDDEKQKGDHYAPTEFNITLHGETYHINLTGSGDPSESERPFYVSVDGISEEVLVETLDEVLVSKPTTSSTSSERKKTTREDDSRSKPTHDGCVATAMPGKIVDIKVSVGDKVKAGDSVVVIEAMKMENEIQAAISGIVIAVNISKGDEVSPNETLLEIQA